MLDSYTAAPRSRIDAAHILANPAAYAAQPSLIALARLVSASAEGMALPQRRRDGFRARPATTPVLRVIEGGRQQRLPAPTGPEAA